ncbi:hypothetical protein B0O99DRAFT_599057 [Bisporella sp. PMI_857]|nr:hypothetical protein B0O99DRAFT_599057 [Bisporella sp. PMI_857]
MGPLHRQATSYITKGLVRIISPMNIGMQKLHIRRPKDMNSIQPVAMQEVNHLPTFSSCRTGATTRSGRVAKSTRSGVSGSDRGKEDETHNIRRIHTCLPYTSLETTLYPGRQELQHTGLHRQPQEQTLPNAIKALDGLSQYYSSKFSKELTSTYYEDAKLFSSTQYLTELGQDICDRPPASEKDLEIYQRLAVEQSTTHIKIFSGGIISENYANTLSDSNEEVQQSP